MNYYSKECLQLKENLDELKGKCLHLILQRNESEKKNKKSKQKKSLSSMLDEEIKQQIEQLKTEINKKEKEYLSLRDVEDNKELIRRVDSSGIKGYKIESGDIQMLLASYRLCSNPNGSNVKSEIKLEEREPWNICRKSSK